MKRNFFFIGLATLTLVTTACSSTTTRRDVRDARRDVGRAYLYGDERDVRDAHRDYEDTKRDYRRDRRRDRW